MNIAYFNGKFLPKDEIKISPDDRGFLFAEGIYEVMKWYEGFYYDMESHLIRMKRSLGEIRINWPEADTFPAFAVGLIKRNQLSDRQALIYLQVTRGAAPRTHSFPDPEVNPTVYAFAKELSTSGIVTGSGVKVMLKEDIRWSRCDIKSIALLANTLSFQEAHEKGLYECIFVRNGLINEGSRSNIFFVIDGILYTHPESEHILSGVTRKNILRIAREAGIPVKEEPLPVEKLGIIHEAFITNTSSEVTPVIAINELKIGDGIPGPVTMLIHKIFLSEIIALKG
jgi:D-alanine transaminase